MLFTIPAFFENNDFFIKFILITNYRLAFTSMLTD